VGNFKIKVGLTTVRVQTIVQTVVTKLIQETRLKGVHQYITHLSNASCYFANLSSLDIHLL